jgi:hypothetical protein
MFYGSNDVDRIIKHYLYSVFNKIIFYSFLKKISSIIKIMQPTRIKTETKVDKKSLPKFLYIEYIWKIINIITANLNGNVLIVIITLLPF